MFFGAALGLDFAAELRLADVDLFMRARLQERSREVHA
jgi:hypothetical protein